MPIPTGKLNGAGKIRRAHNGFGARVSFLDRSRCLAWTAPFYPCELSVCRKQRVGMARPFSLDPQMLFMDEPLSQVDALRAKSLRAEVLDLWAAVEAEKPDTGGARWRH